MVVVGRRRVGGVPGGLARAMAVVGGGGGGRVGRRGRHRGVGEAALVSRMVPGCSLGRAPDGARDGCDPPDGGVCRGDVAARVLPPAHGTSAAPREARWCQRKLLEARNSTRPHGPDVLTPGRDSSRAWRRLHLTRGTRPRSTDGMGARRITERPAAVHPAGRFYARLPPPRFPFACPSRRHHAEEPPWHRARRGQFDEGPVGICE